MKRPALRSHVPLRRTSSLAPQSAKRKAIAPKRRQFVLQFLSEHRECQARLEGCWIGAVDVHEWIPRSAGGAIVPGPKADAQGQCFMALCRKCHSYISDNTGWAREMGLLK